MQLIRKNKNDMKKGIILFLLCCVAFFVNNSVILPDIMESRNIVTAREMVHDGNWMVPTMNGELRLEKPPLPTWIAGAVEYITPDNISAQRAMAGLAGMVLICFFYLLGEKITRNKDYAFIASLLLLTCYNVILMGRTATWDIYCHAFMMGAIYFMYRGFYEDKHIYKWFLWAGIFLGLSFLSKGPVSFYALLLPFLICTFVYKKPQVKGKVIAITIMILLCLILSSWWYLYIWEFHQEAVQCVLHKESSAWADHNVRPWYYYWKFFLETGVWSLLMITTLMIPFWKKRVQFHREYIFAISWTLIMLVLLSFMPEKKPRYLLPMMIPCCYSMAYLIFYWWKQSYVDNVDKWIYRINAGLISIACFALPIAMYIMFYRKGTVSTCMFLFLTILLWTVTTYILYSTYKGKPVNFVYGVVALFAIAELFLMPFIGDVANNPDFKSIKKTREIKSLDKLPFYSNNNESLRIELVYAANRKILPLNIKDEKQIIKSLPCVILTHKRVGQEFPTAMWNKIDTSYIGCFNDNRRPKSNMHYSEDFVYNATILKLKTCSK